MKNPISVSLKREYRKQKIFFEILPSSSIKSIFKTKKKRHKSTPKSLFSHYTRMICEISS